MLFTLTIVDTRSMTLVALIVVSRVGSVVDVCDEMHFVLLCVSPTSFNISSQTGVFPLVIAVCGKKLSFKANPCQKLLSCFAGCVT